LIVELAHEAAGASRRSLSAPFDSPSARLICQAMTESERSEP